MPSLGKQFLMSIFNARHKKLVVPLSRELIETVTTWPAFRPEALVVAGAGEVSGMIGARTADLVASDELRKTGTIYFVGGVSPLWKARRQGLTDLIDAQEKAGIPRPSETDTESSWMEKAYFQRLKERKADLITNGVDPTWFTVVRDENRNNNDNAQLVMKKAAALGATQHENLGLVAIAYYALRTTLTWTHENGRDIALRPLPVFADEIGITRNNWQSSSLARAFIAAEGLKFVRPSPENSEFARKGFCDPATPANIIMLRAQARDALGMDMGRHRVFKP